MRRRAWARMRERRAQLLYIWPERPGTLVLRQAHSSRGAATDAARVGGRRRAENLINVRNERHQERHRSHH